MPQTKGKLFRALFVDDDKDVHNYEREIAEQLRIKPRFAFSPEEAEAIISKRLDAIERLYTKKQKQMKLIRSQKLRKILLQQLRFLGRMRKKPFDLIVSDINMPIGNPMGFRFVIKLRRRFPEQKVITHSDDLEHADLLERRHGVKPSTKLNFKRDELLKLNIKKQLSRRRL